MSHFRPAVVLEAIELRHRAGERPNSWPVLPIIAFVLLWILLARWWPVCEQCGARL